MSSSPSPSLALPLPCPVHGAASRVRVGDAEAVLERVRGGYTLLWTDGRQSRRFAIGLAAGGQLTIELRAPRLLVRVAPRESLTVVPHGRLRGYVLVPLVPTVVWRGEAADPVVLVELHPHDLRATWDERLGHAFDCSSPWLHRFPVPSGAARIVVPLRLANGSAAPLSPAHLLVRLADRDLLPLRGNIIVRPRRTSWAGDGFITADLRAHLAEQHR